MERLFWLLGIICPCLLVAALVISKQWRLLPIFSANVVYQALKVMMMYPIQRWGTSSLFEHMYWTLAGIDYAMQVAIMVELARFALRCSGTWITGTFRYFIAYTSTIAFASAIISLSLNLSTLTRSAATEARLTLFTSLLTCGFTLAMTSAANRLRLKWAPTVLAVARGFAIWSTVSVIINCFEVAKGWDSSKHPWLGGITGGVWFLVCFYWTAVFLFPKGEATPGPPDFQGVALVLLDRVKDDKRGLIT